MAVQHIAFQKRGQVHLHPFEPQLGGLCAGLMPAKR
jgi:hypothetical protein